jgi:purine-nucleoside phosphorylase
MNVAIQAGDFIKNEIFNKTPLTDIPQTVVVLGSGLSSFKDTMDVWLEIPYSSIPGFQVSEVSGHGNSLLVGFSENIPIIAMNGRFHYYEGIDMSSLSLPIKAFKTIGVKNLVLSAAVGSLIEDMKPGSIMAINDHIKFFDESPLRGKNEEIFGPRFPDMTSVYKIFLIRDELKDYMENELKVPYFEGVYAFMPGPSYETPAEIKALKMLGASVVGMSTVPEAITANYCGINVYGFATITNMAAGISKTKLSHKEVIEAGKEITKIFSKVINKTLKLINKE